MKDSNLPPHDPKSRYLPHDLIPGNLANEIAKWCVVFTRRICLKIQESNLLPTIHKIIALPNELIFIKKVAVCA